jgi:hypothetical protein
MTLHEVVFYSAHGKLRLEQPNQTKQHPPSQTVAHKENSRFEVDKAKAKVTRKWPCVCIS